MFVTEHPESADNVALGAASDDELTHHQRNAYQQHEKDIYQEKGAAAVAAQHIGKTPYIAQSYCPASRSQYGTDIRGKTSIAVSFHFSSPCSNL